MGTYESGCELRIALTPTIAVSSLSYFSLSWPTIWQRQHFVDQMRQSNTPRHHGALRRLDAQTGDTMLNIIISNNRMNHLCWSLDILPIV